MREKFLAMEKQKQKPKKKKKPIKFKYYKMEELHPDDITLEDVLNQLNRLLALIGLERFYIYDSIPPITKQFEPGGVAADFVVSLETFKMAVYFLKICRKEVDIRIMKVYWPLFHQLYLHLNLSSLNEAVAHFYSNKELLDTGAGTLHKIAKMEESFLNFDTEFEAACQFVVKERYSSVDDKYRAKCRHLCFFLMFHPRRFVKMLTMEAMLQQANTNPDAIYNLVQLFYIVPSLILHHIPTEDENSTEPLAVALVRRIYHHELDKKEMQWKRELLGKMTHWLSGNGFEITNVCTPLIGLNQFDGVFDEPQQQMVNGSQA